MKAHIGLLRIPGRTFFAGVKRLLAEVAVSKTICATRVRGRFHEDSVVRLARNDAALVEASV